MKKQVLLVAAALGMTFATNAQDLTSKSGHAILPEAGDIALGFDASPLFNYVGNMFNGSAGNSFNTGWTNANNAIYGKYYLDASTAVRGWVRLGFGSNTEKAYVTQDGQPDPLVTVEDTWKSSYNNIVIGGGIEMRRGHNRLQGYYGGDLLVVLGGTSDEYTYGNALDAATGFATRSNFNGNDLGGSWETSSSAGSTFGLGIRGVIGVEYFLAPKVSLGAEYAWGLGMMSTGDGESTYEYSDGSAIVTETTTSAGSSSFGIDTDMNNMMFGGGSVKLLFHF